MHAFLLLRSKFESSLGEEHNSQQILEKSIHLESNEESKNLLLTQHVHDPLHDVVLLRLITAA